MSSFFKFLIVALTASTAVAASAHADAPAGRGLRAQSVIATHEAQPTLTAIAHPVRHRHHHHRAKHRAHRAAHTR